MVKNLTDVETLGATSAINTDKTGTLTMNEMMVSTMYAERLVVHRRRRGLRQDRGHPVGGRRHRCRTSPGSRSASRSTATPPSPTTATSSATRPRPRSSCWPPSSASTPRRPAGPTRGSPRCRSTPSTSSWRRSTASRSTASTAVIELVKGGPDVVLARCTQSGGPLSRSPVPIDAGPRRHRRRQRPDGREGPARARLRGPRRRRRRARGAADDPMSLRRTTWRSSASSASSTRCAPSADDGRADRARAGIDVRMITGDHAVTAQAIGETLGPRPRRDQRRRAAGA